MEMPGHHHASPYGSISHTAASPPTAPFVPVPRPGLERLSGFEPGVGVERVGDSERSAVCDALSAHFAAGRLSAEDLEYRLTMAVQAVTRDDLYRLTADLPVAAHATAPALRPPTAQRAWPAMSVLAVLALIGSFLAAGGMLMVLGAVEPFLFIAACFGGTAAAVGGASGTYLLMRHVRLRRNDE